LFSKQIANRVHNDPSRSSNRKRVGDFLLALSCNLGHILPRFRDIRAFVLFAYYSPIPAKIYGCSL